MLNSEIAQNSIYFAQDFRRDYDAHIYYDETTRDQALALRDLALKNFKDRPVFISRMVDHRVGPHPLPMFEINFSKELFPEALEWLKQNRKNLTILVHEVTGDDPKDHSEGALWLGDALPLDFSKLDPSPLKKS